MARSSITTQFGSVAALIGVLTINFLSVSLPLNGNTPGALSDLYPNLFTPAGSTFSIWGIIYTLLIIWVLAPFWGQESAKRGAANIGNLFLYTCILNGAWLFAWHWQLTALSVAIMVALLLVLIRINVLLRDPAIQPFWALPFGVYQGWMKEILRSVIVVQLRRGFCVSVVDDVCMEMRNLLEFGYWLLLYF